MKVLQLSTFDKTGGAARAAMRLHHGLRNIGVDSWAVVHKKESTDPYVIENRYPGLMGKSLAMSRPYIDEIPLLFYPRKKNTPWNLAWLPNHLGKVLRDLSPSIVHAHWINAGFLSLYDLSRIQSKLVWTLHDAWQVTGGCHIFYGCSRFQLGCGICPQLGSQTLNDLSAKGIARKKLVYDKIQPTFVAPSRWMASQAQSSYLLKDAAIKVIPHGLDIKIFYPIDKVQARKKLNLPLDKKIILFGAMSGMSDPNKGFDKLLAALQILSTSPLCNEIEIAIFGSAEPTNKPNYGFPTHYLGKIADDNNLCAIYSAADVFCAPSREESFGQVALEAMACATPVVAFATTGLLDTVDHQVTGYLAQPFEEKDFAHGIEFILEDPIRIKILAKNARLRIVNHFDISLMAKRYQELYASLL